MVPSSRHTEDDSVPVHVIIIIIIIIIIITRGQSIDKKRLTGAHSPVRGHPRGSKVVPLNSWGRVSY